MNPSPDDRTADPASAAAVGAGDLAAGPAAELAGVFEADRDHLIHPWADLRAARATGSFVVAAAKGAHVVDGEGRRLLDAMGGMWCVNIGHGRDEMADAIAEQVRRLHYFSPFYQTTNPPAARLAARLAALAPGDLDQICFTTCGSTAADTALRFALYYWRTLGQPERRHIISRDHAYHGSTHLTASVSRDPADHDRMALIEDGIHSLSCPDPLRRRPGQSVEAFRDERVAELEQKILEIGPERVACFIAEPIQGAGGVIVPPEGYPRACREICRRYGVLYIGDEVITGFGRLGHMFASEPVFGLVPDILIAAKGLTSAYVPLGAVMISRRLVDDIVARGAEPEFLNGYTFSGHPVACAAALKNIEIIEREDLCGRVRALAPYLQERARALAALPLVGDVRGMGLIVAFELMADPARLTPLPDAVRVGRRVSEACRRRGVIVRPLDNLVVLSPPLIVGRAEIDQMIDAVAGAVTETAEMLAREGGLPAG